MNKLLCHTEGDSCFIHESIAENISKPVNFMAVKKPLKIIHTPEGIALDYGSTVNFTSYKEFKDTYCNTRDV